MHGPAAIDCDTIISTAELLKPYLRRTPIVEVDSTDFGFPAGRLIFKLELLQHAGSFKTRGAFANLLTRRIPRAGVVAASSGNHGAAVAYAAMKIDVPATIFVPAVASAAKIDRIRGYGANLIVAGQSYAEALAACDGWLAESGALPIHAYDQRETLLGQGNIGFARHKTDYGRCSESLQNPEGRLPLPHSYPAVINRGLASAWVC